MDDRIARLATFGKGGDTVEYGSGCYGSGYGTPECPHSAVNLPECCPVIDMRPAIDDGDGITMSIRGPMVNVDLDNDTVDPLNINLEDSIMARAMMEDVGNSFGSLAAMQIVSECGLGPLDCVSTDLYIKLWSAAGARVGEYRNGGFQWNDGTTTIPRLPGQ